MAINVRAEASEAHLTIANIVGSVNGRPVKFPDEHLSFSAEQAIPPPPPPTPSMKPEPDGDGEAFDCFLSHNGRDKPAVRELAQTLRGRGISVWLDEERLRPGLPWQPLLETGIRASRSVAVLVGRDGLGPWQDEEMMAALNVAVADKRPVIPVLLANASAVPDLPMFLKARTWVKMHCAPDSGGLSALDQLIWGITGKRPV